MGNEPSKSNSRLGVCAIAFTTTNIEAAEFQIIADKIKTFADPSICSRTEFDDAIKEIEKFEESDRELLTRLFVMFDNTGESIIAMKEYMAGVGGCVCSGSVVEKLAIACKLYDLSGTGTLDRADMKKILNSINLVTSYFGDPVVTPADIDKCVHATFEHNAEPTAPMKIDEAVPLIAEHEVVDLFIQGRGTVKFGR